MPGLKKAEYGWQNGKAPEGNLCFNTLVPDNVATIISKVVKRYLKNNQDIRFIHCLYNQDTFAGSYCVTTSKTKWFVRITSRTGDVKLESDLLDYLSRRGVSANLICFSTTIQDDKKREYRLDIRPFISGQHFTGTTDELESLLLHLGHLHKVLNEFPGSTVIKKKAAARYNTLKKMWNHVHRAVSTGQFDIFHEAELWAENNRVGLEKMARHFKPDFHLSEDAQPLHGELHTGNVVFEGIHPVFIDFEESIQIYASPLWDLAYVIQRFCFWENPTTEQLADRCRLVLRKFEPDVNYLINMMRQSAWLSITVLLDLRLNKNVVSPVSEYEKFIEMESLADIVKPLIK